MPLPDRNGACSAPDRLGPRARCTVSQCIKPSPQAVGNGASCTPDAATGLTQRCESQRIEIGRPDARCKTGRLITRMDGSSFTIDSFLQLQAP